MIRDRVRHRRERHGVHWRGNQIGERQVQGQVVFVAGDDPHVVQFERDQIGRVIHQYYLTSQLVVVVS